MLLDICGGHVGVGAEGITLIITGGFRTESDFVKALALGADGIAISHSTLQGIGCLGMRACHSTNCSVGIATKKKELRARLPVEESAQRLASFFAASTELMQVLARAGGHGHLRDVTIRDFTTWSCDTSDLTGVRFGGVGTPQA